MNKLFFNMYLLFISIALPVCQATREIFEVAEVKDEMKMLRDKLAPADETPTMDEAKPQYIVIVTVVDPKLLNAVQHIPDSMEDDDKDKIMRIQALAMSLVDQSVVLVVEGDEKTQLKPCDWPGRNSTLSLRKQRAFAALMMLASMTSSVQGR